MICIVLPLSPNLSSIFAYSDEKHQQHTRSGKQCAAHVQ